MKEKPRRSAESWPAHRAGRIHADFLSRSKGQCFFERLPASLCVVLSANFLIRPSNSNHLETSHTFPWTLCDCRLLPVSVNLLYTMAIGVPHTKISASFQ